MKMVKSIVTSDMWSASILDGQGGKRVRGDRRRSLAGRTEHCVKGDNIYSQEQDVTLMTKGPNELPEGYLLADVEADAR